MPNNTEYFLIKRRVLPEVFLKVVEAKKILEKDDEMTIQKVVDIVGISRSSFYKYKDDIFPFYENSRGSVITVALKVDDEPGLLAKILEYIAECKANILTIHQTIPINGVANLTVSMEILPETSELNDAIKNIESFKGCHSVKVLAKE